MESLRPLGKPPTMKSTGSVSVVVSVYRGKQARSTTHPCNTHS